MFAEEGWERLGWALELVSYVLLNVFVIVLMIMGLSNLAREMFTERVLGTPGMSTCVGELYVC